MSLSLNTNVAALNAQRNLQATENKLSVSMEQLSSGLSINTAADNVAGYAISEQMEGQIGGLNQANQNTQDAVALSQTAQGSLNEVEQILQQVRSLAVQYENGTNSTEDKTAIEGEVTQLSEQIKTIGETTQFNGISLLKAAGEVSFQVGANAKETIAVNTIDLATEVGTITMGKEGEGITKTEEAINKVATAAAEFGSVQDRLQYTQSNLEIYSQNLSSANSSIKDVNMAEAMTNFTQEQVLQQAGVAILSQANSLPQAVLKLVGS
jgi:flagellin